MDRSEQHHLQEDGAACMVVMLRADQEGVALIVITRPLLAVVLSMFLDHSTTEIIHGYGFHTNFRSLLGGGRVNALCTKRNHQRHFLKVNPDVLLVYFCNTCRWCLSPHSDPQVGGATLTTYFCSGGSYRTAVVSGQACSTAQ